MKAIMIVWIGLAKSQTFDTEAFADIETCAAARLAMAESIGEKWGSWVYDSKERFLENSICVELP